MMMMPKGVECTERLLSMDTLAPRSQPEPLTVGAVKGE